MLKNTLTFAFASLLFFNFSCKKQVDETIATVTNSKDTVVVDSTEITQPDWAKNAVIYEVNIRQFSNEGNFEAVTNDLQRIKDLGVDVIWLMPIHPIGEKNRKGTMGSYYAVKDYKAVNPEFGTIDDFKALVNKAHALGLKVIIDWVANHSSPDNIWVEENIEFYTKDSLGNAPIPTVGTDWLDVADLNYDNPDMRAAMQDAMTFWVKETDIDGFRCDVAELVPMDFWVDTRKKLDAIKPVFMLAEGKEPELYEAFNMTYGWPFKDVLIKIADKEKGIAAIQEYISDRNKNYDPNDLIMYFTTNHDENSWNYLENEKFGNNLQNYTALTYFMGGMPLIYSGQEAGLEKQIEFFEKDPIVWGDYKHAEFFKNIISVYKNNEVLWNGGDEWGKFEILSAENEGFHFIKEKNGKLIAVLQNYSNHPQYVSEISLNGLDIKTNLLGNQPTTVSEKGLEIPPHATIIIGQKK